jgi:hypothetical protein
VARGGGGAESMSTAEWQRSQSEGSQRGWAPLFGQGS